MKGVLHALITMAALLVATGAGLAAWYVGTDDTVMLPESSPATNGAPVIVNPRLLAYDDLTVVVRARSDSGPVVIGSGDPIDLTAYAEGAEHYWLHDIDGNGKISGQHRDGDALPQPLGAVEFFDEAARGPGEQVLHLELDGSSRALVIGPAAGRGGTTLAAGARLDGLFWLLVITAVVSGLVLAGSAYLHVRRRRRTHLSSHAGIPSADGRGSATTTTTRSLRTASRTGIAVLGVGLVSAGCVAVPDAVEYTEPTRPAIAPGGLDEVVRDVETRLRRSFRGALPPKRSPRAVRAAASGPRYEMRRFDVALQESADTPRKDLYRDVRLEPVTVHAAAFSAYPMWALVSTEWSTTPDFRSKEQEQADRKHPKLRASVLTRAGPTQPWLVESTVRVRAADMPEPRAVGASSAPTARQRERAREVSQALTRYWRDKRELPTGLVLDDTVKSLHSAVREWRKGNAGLTVRVLPFESRGHGASGAGAPTEPLRVVRVQDGALAMLSYRTTFITFARRTLQWQQPLAGVYGEDDHVFLRDYWIGSVLVHLPDDPDQDAKVLGGGFGRTMPP